MLIEAAGKEPMWSVHFTHQSISQTVEVVYFIRTPSLQKKVRDPEVTIDGVNFKDPPSEPFCLKLTERRNHLCLILGKPSVST